MAVTLCGPQPPPRPPPQNPFSRTGGFVSFCITPPTAPPSKLIGESWGGGEGLGAGGVVVAADDNGENESMRRESCWIAPFSLPSQTEKQLRSHFKTPAFALHNRVFIRRSCCRALLAYKGRATRCAAAHKADTTGRTASLGPTLSPSPLP